MKTLKLILDQVDEILDSYDPGELDPKKIVREIFEHRAQQAPMLRKAVSMCDSGLEKYPYNPELMRRRALLKTLIVTPDAEHPELEEAAKDLRTLLELDPNNLYAGLELLKAMFTFSGMEDSDVADVAEELADRAKSLMLVSRSLQIEALAYANRKDESDSIYDKLIQLFPDSEELKYAKDSADSFAEGRISSL